MRIREAPSRTWRPQVLGLVAIALSMAPSPAQTKPTGAPLVLSNIETEQPIPLATIAADGKTANCALIRLHWISKPDAGPDDDPTSFSLDLPVDNPAAPIFLAQLWNASLASALAWQEPWQGARWKVLDTPVTDGSGLDAALAVGMISTSARRPYPPKTVVIGSLNPDGSLGPVSHLVARIHAAAAAGMTRAIIPSVQRFEKDSSGQVVNVVQDAKALNLDCVPVDDLVTATETTMNDPLPDTTLDAALPKYSQDVTNLIDEYARQERGELDTGLKFAPKEADLASYPGHLGGIWKSVYLDDEAGLEAYGAGQVYVAYQLFARANGRMNGANALAGQSAASFDVKAALADSDTLHEQVHSLMHPPSIDHGDLQSAVVVAEMADWAFEVNAALEGAQTVTRQAFSQRSDATEAEKDRAREAIVFANAQCRYLVGQSGFYTRLLDRVAAGAPINVDANAEHLLPQLIPAQLATARSFTAGIRGTDLRDGLLFDSRLVAYVNVLRQAKMDWDARLRRKQNADAAASASAPATPTTPATNVVVDAATAPVELNSKAPVTAGAFDPGDTYKPPSSAVVASTPTRKLSDAALCLIWVNNDCEIASLEEKYLRLDGSMDPASHEWKVKDHAKLDALLQMAEIGARRGISFATQTGIDPSILAMIYERAAHQRTRGTDASSLDSLRNYWRCALLGNMCWQLAHTHKAEAVDISTLAPPETKPSKKAGKKTEAKVEESTKKSDAAISAAKSSEATSAAPAEGSSTNSVVSVDVHGDTTTTTHVEPPPAVTPTPAPVTPGTADTSPPAPATSMAEQPVATPPVASPVAAPAEMSKATSAPDAEASIPVARVANASDLGAPGAIPPTAPAAAPAPENISNPSVSSTPIMFEPPVAPLATNAVANVTSPAPPPAPVAAPTNAIASAPVGDDAKIPVARIARPGDLAGDPSTNAAPVAMPAPAHRDNADGHSDAFP